MSTTIVPDLTQEELKRLFHYDENTGIFTRLISRSQTKAGDTATCVNGCGYIVIGINHVLHSAHRLAWLYVHGAWPANQIDHINGLRSDNRIANLREATSRINNQNRTTAKGYCAERGGWKASIGVNGKTKHIGRFSTKEEARAAYLAAKKIYHRTAPITVV